MTETSSVDLDAAKEGVKSLYAEPKAKVLDPDAMDKSLLERMPNPTGWRMLILPYRGKETTDGGIIVPNKVLEDGQIQTVVGYVVKQGPLCYQDPKKFPNAKFNPGEALSTPSIICKDLTGDVLLNPLVLITLNPKLADVISTPFI